MFTPMVTTTFSVSPIAVVAANSPVFTLKGSIATVWPFDILFYSAAGAHAFAMEQSASRRHLSSNAQLFSGTAKLSNSVKKNRKIRAVTPFKVIEVGTNRKP